MIPQPEGLLDLPAHVLAKLERFDLSYQVDLGEDHWLSFVTWDPDLSLEGNRQRWGGHVDVIKANPVCGANVIHRCKTETGFHQGAIHFKTPATALWAEPSRGHCWDVHCWSPLEISPSLLAHCPCSDHGFIRGGRWVRA